MTGLPPATSDADPLHDSSAPTSWWSTANLSEAFPGTLTPLGWTVAGPATELGTRSSLYAVGALTRDETPIPDVHDRIFAVFHGRIATRVDYFCQIGDRMPGGGGAAVAEQIFGFVPPGTVSRPTRRRYPAMAVKFPVAFVRAPGNARRVREQTATWWRTSIDRTPTLTAEQARLQFSAGLERFAMHLGVDGVSMFAGTQPVYDQLLRLADKTGVDIGHLVAGSGSHEETDLVTDLWACSRDELDIATVAARYGYHGHNEGEISAFVWREDDSPLRRTVASYRAMSDDRSPEATAAARHDNRVKATREFLAELSAAERPLARALLRLARTYLPLRGKTGRLQALDVARAAARHLGDLLARGGELADPSDVFYLTAAEIVAPLPAQVRDLVAERRRRYVDHTQLSLPQTWQGEPPRITRKDPAAEPASDPAAVTTLTGVGVSPGVVEGRVRVVTDPGADDLEADEIFVAHTTDPGWAALMFMSCAVVVDIGGALSHAAGVARELGVPCVMGLGNATTALKTGDRCRVDGTTGEVTVIARATPGPGRRRCTIPRRS